MTICRLTPAAERDIRDILRDSARMFGPRQRDRYAGLIGAAVTLVAEDPERAGSRPRPEIGPNVRSFHVELAAPRGSAASHLLYYRQDEAWVVILRVLHQAMEPSLHLVTR
ncbi:MAG: type II toxin-antitoxin system RelE/ParE family toxin [Ignavibacteriales bacterium]